MPPASSPRFYALVPCAGAGERAQKDRPKQYVEVAGAAVVAHTLAALAQVHRLTLTMVVLAPDDRQFEGHVPSFVGAVTRTGGATRAATVARGLAQLRALEARADDWVLVHDAARCLVRPEWIDALIDSCGDDAVGGLLALPVADTLKREREGRVAATLARAAIWQAQTPQMFRIEPLQQALLQAPTDVSDEAGAMEALGLAPRLVRGSPENFKLTYPGDFDLAERLLRSRA